MGSVPSTFDDLPDKVSWEEIEDFIAKNGLQVKINRIRFDLLKNCDGKISRLAALQLIENKQPPIYSLNGMVTH